MEDLIGELNIAMNERDQQMDSALLSVAQVMLTPRPCALMRLFLSPPPPLGPAVLLRSGLEGGCLYFQEPLELLARATCDLEVPHQRFVWEPASRTLR